MKRYQFFVVSRGVVSGPFRVGDFDIRTFNDPEAQFWAQGFESWRPLNTFSAFVRQMEQKEFNPATTQWHLRVGEREIGPMNRWDLQTSLGKMPDLTDVRLRTEERKTWQVVYDFPQIIEGLGISRRTVPRAAMMGHVLFKRGSETVIAKARSISENGLGAICPPQQDVGVGDTYSIVIDSPHFDETIAVQGEVLYRFADLEVGVFFHGLSAEARAKIISYVKRYSEVLKQKLAIAA